MELEPLFTATKWNIIELLSTEPISPLELAKKTGTSIANISQQLRLLEVAGIVSSKRLGTQAKGKPRVLYFLSKEYAYILSMGSSGADKKLIEASPHQQALLKIWFIEDKSLHRPLEEFFESLESQLDKIDAVFIDKAKDQVVLASDYKGVHSHAGKVVKGDEKKISVRVIGKRALAGYELSKKDFLVLFYSLREGLNESKEPTD